MEWTNYKRSFIRKAQSKGYNNDYITKWLNYANELFLKNLPVIYNQTHLSLLVGYHLDYLLKVSNAPNKFYRRFEITKKNGTKRKISEPLPNLKVIQKWILDNILYNCNVSEYSKAYRQGKSIKDNAKFHRKQKIILNVDIHHYFESFSQKDVYKLFLSLGYAPAVAIMLSNLCCLSNSLPQGAVTSPALSNILTIKMDEEISNFCRKFNLRYTRYADDITISGEFKVKKVLRFLEKTIVNNGFKLNANKTRVRYSNQRQEVTGIIVNQKLQAPREMRRNLRMTIYFINKYGLQSHMKKNDIVIEEKLYLQKLLGKAYYMNFLNRNDKEVLNYIKLLKKLHKEVKNTRGFSLKNLEENENTSD